MGNALALVVVGGIVGTGILFHTGYLFAAICVGLAAYAAVRWMWVNWA